MSLRPRYSLLTLLVLTAAFAVGIKLWRGPHRAIMSDPPTLEEMSLLDQLDNSRGVRDLHEPAVYEYEYLQEWNSRRYLCLQGHPVGKRPISVIHWCKSSNNLHVMYRRGNETPAELALDLEHAKWEQVHCWFYQTNGPVKDMNPTQEQKREMMCQEITRAIATNCYFLTSRRKLYLFHAFSSQGLMLKPVDLHEIDDSALRERIAAELEKIPVPTTSQ